MKLAGLLLLPAGWLIALAAMVLFPMAKPRAAFVAVGVIIEVAGLIMTALAHRVQRGASE